MPVSPVLRNMAYTFFSDPLDFGGFINISPINLCIQVDKSLERMILAVMFMPFHWILQ